MVACQRAARPYLEVLRSLAEIQKYITERIVVPQSISHSDAREIIGARDLLLGQEIVDEWEFIEATITEPTMPGSGDVQLLTQVPLTVPIDGQRIQLDAVIQIHMMTARLDEETSTVAVGQRARFVPGAVNTRTIRLVSQP
jgi:hypothetical protein